MDRRGRSVIPGCAEGAIPESITPAFPEQFRRGLWIPALAEPVIGPRFARTRWLGRNDGREVFALLSELARALKTTQDSRKLAFRRRNP